MFKISFKISRFYLMFFVIERSVLCMLVQNNVNYKISLVSKSLPIEANYFVNFLFSDENKN